jgi:hypothetical protein
MQLNVSFLKTENNLFTHEYGVINLVAIHAQFHWQIDSFLFIRLFADNFPSKFDIWRFFRKRLCRCWFISGVITSDEMAGMSGGKHRFFELN